MTSARVFFTSAIATLCLVGTANAQGDYITQCRDSDSDSERITCLENAIRTLQSETVAVNDGAEVTTLADLKDNEPAIDTPAGLGAEQVLARQDRKKPKEERIKDKANNTVTVALSDYAVAANGEYILFLTNGQVWRQKAKANARVRLFQGKDYTVTVKKGALSGYRATINEAKRTFVVERVK